MTGQDAGIRECPFCREEVKAQATRCKHCHAAIPAEEGRQHRELARREPHLDASALAAVGEGIEHE